MPGATLYCSTRCKHMTHSSHSLEWHDSTITKNFPSTLRNTLVVMTKHNATSPNQGTTQKLLRNTQPNTTISKDVNSLTQISPFSNVFGRPMVFVGFRDCHRPGTNFFIKYSKSHRPEVRSDLKRKNARDRLCLSPNLVDYCAASFPSSAEPLNS